MNAPNLNTAGMTPAEVLHYAGLGFPIESALLLDAAPTAVDESYDEGFSAGRDAGWEEGRRDAANEFRRAFSRLFDLLNSQFDMRDEALAEAKRLQTAVEDL